MGEKDIDAWMERSEREEVKTSRRVSLERQRDLIP